MPSKEQMKRKRATTPNGSPTGPVDDREYTLDHVYTYDLTKIGLATKKEINFRSLLVDGEPLLTTEGKIKLSEDGTTIIVLPFAEEADDLRFHLTEFLAKLGVPVMQGSEKSDMGGALHLVEEIRRARAEKDAQIEAEKKTGWRSWFGG